MFAGAKIGADKVALNKTLKDLKLAAGGLVLELTKN